LHRSNLAAINVTIVVGSLSGTHTISSACCGRATHNCRYRLSIQRWFCNPSWPISL